MTNRCFYWVISMLLLMAMFTRQSETLAKSDPEPGMMSRLRLAAPGVFKATSAPNGLFDDAPANIPESAPVAAFVTFRGFVTTVETVETPDSTCWGESYSIGVQLGVIIDNPLGTLTGKTHLRVYYTNSHNFPVGSAVEVYGAMVLGSGSCSGSQGVVIVDEASIFYITPSVIYSTYLPIVAANGGASQASLPDSPQLYFPPWAMSGGLWSRYTPVAVKNRD